MPETPLLLPRALSFLRSRDLMLYVIGGLITGVVGWLPRGFVRRSDWASSFGHQSWAAFSVIKGDATLETRAVSISCNCFVVFSMQTWLIVTVNYLALHGVRNGKCG